MRAALRGVKHPLNRISLSLLGLIFLVYISFNAISFQPADVETLRVNCFYPNQMSVHETKGQDKRNRILSWDVSALNSAQLSLQSHKELISVLQRSIDRAFREGSSLVFINLQGVPKPWRHKLEALLLDRGGCWSYAPMWRHPPWLEALGLESYISALYRVLYSRSKENNSPEHLKEHGLWSAVIGISRDKPLSAERWAMIPKPGRWPRRLFNPQPAALSLELSDFKVINLKLPDSAQKHQSGALSLQRLKRPPLRERLRKPWVIIGDWRVSPINDLPHKEAGYRFQRYSLIEMNAQAKGLFSKSVDQDRWGRWRQREGQTPAVIDLAYRSSGTLTPIDVGAEDQPLYWLKGEEERAMLMVDWWLED